MYELDRQWWLGIAKSLVLGESVRVQHPLDKHKSPSVVIRNSTTGYHVRCHRRNVTDWVSKEHVIPSKAPEESADPMLPLDLVETKDIPHTDPTLKAVRGWLLSKGLDTTWIDDACTLYYSKDRQRLLFRLDIRGYTIILGRDMTGGDVPKWVDYTPSITNKRVPLVLDGTYMHEKLVIVEDTLSALKVYRAMRGEVSVMAALGTKLSMQQMYEVSKYSQVRVFFDGDNAGRVGAKRTMRVAQQALGVIDTKVIFPSRGRDPKDFKMASLRKLVENSWTYYSYEHY